MCGIIGFVSQKKHSLDVLIEGLERLEYRGYDSAGLAYYDDKQINIIKQVGKVQALKEKTELSKQTTLGMAHTRWATHGKPNVINSHPHQCGSITVIHNGIIENYLELKEELINKGYFFKTETDTEVASALLDYLYNRNHSMKKALTLFHKKVRGTYALGIINSNEPNHLYALKKDSPLIIGVDNKTYFLTSDISAILKYTNKYMVLEDGDSAILTYDKVTIINGDGNKIARQCQVSNQEIEDISKSNYQHYMLKEINEEPLIISKLINLYLNNGIDSLVNQMPDFSKYNVINVVACGSAMHAGLIGKTLIETFAHIPVTVELASEYRYKKLFIDKKTLVIFISQSGETADTLAAVKIVKSLGVDTLGIINVANSSIARTVDYVLYTKAGSEIAVATTKAYCAQITMLSLIALNIGVTKKVINNDEFKNIISNYNNLSDALTKALNNYKEYISIAHKIREAQNIFFIGRGIDYAIAMEGALKLKEISYIHSEAYAAGELKHGTISLIDKDVPVIAIVTDSNIVDKTMSNIKEVKARDAKVIVITTTPSNYEGDNDEIVVRVPQIHSLLQPIVTVIPLQLIAYEVAKLRGCDIDKPRNLAKSVTVE